MLFQSFLIEIQNNTMIISERSTLSATARRSHTWLTKVSRTVRGNIPCLSRDVIYDYKKSKTICRGRQIPLDADEDASDFNPFYAVLVTAYVF